MKSEALRRDQEMQANRVMYHANAFILYITWGILFLEVPSLDYTSQNNTLGLPGEPAFACDC